MPVALEGLKTPVFYFTRQFESMASISMLPGWTTEDAENTEYLAVKVDLRRPETWQKVFLQVMEVRRAQLAAAGWDVIGWGNVSACDRRRPMLAAFLRRARR